jgi:DNA-directed RNA polymerase beta subunit
MVLNVLLFLNCTVLLVYSFGQSLHANGTKLYSARIIPFKGSWIEFATDINNVMYAYIDRKKKLPVTTLLACNWF